MPQAISRYINSSIIVIISMMMVQCDGSVKKSLPQIPIEKIQQGDIVFRRGESMASEVVLFNDADGKYSHVGIVVECDSGMMVVHAVPGENPKLPNYDLIVMERIDKFFAPEAAVMGEIMRMDLDSTKCCLLSKLAIEKVKQKVPFDHNYDLSDTTKLYCTELLQHLYEKIGIDLAQGRITSINVPGMTNDYIMPSDIYHNDKLKSIFIY